jgi:hypothetical protein
MTAALRAVAGWFVAPAPPAAGGAPPAAPLRAGRRIAVLGSAVTAAPLAAAVALTARADGAAPTALVLLWRSPLLCGPPPGPAAPALPAARRLAARLGRRELPAVARGRLVWLVLPGTGDDGACALHHAEAAAGDVPAVLALARPREAAVDAVLAESGLAVVAAQPGSALAIAALEDVADLRVPACACPPPPSGAARLAALAGLRAPRLALPLPEEPRRRDAATIRPLWEKPR